MPVHLKEYHRPVGRMEALTLLRRSGIRTATLANSPRPAALFDFEAEAVVDLSQLNLAYVTVTDESVRLGAQTALQDMVESPLLNTLANGILPEAARLAAHFGLRHLATLEGALLASEKLPELSLVLLALGARVVTCQSGGDEREVPLADFLGSPRPTDELTIEARFAWKSGAKVGGALVRVARTPRDAAIFAAAAVVEAENGHCRSARLALAPSGIPTERVAAWVQTLEGQAITPEVLQPAVAALMAEADPPADFRASASYRRAMAGVLVRRAFETAWQRALA